MKNWKRLLVLVLFTGAIGAASLVAEDEVNAQTAGSSGTASSAGTSAGGTSSTPTPTAGTGTSESSTEKKSSGCSIAAPSSGTGFGALVGLALGLALWRRRR
jgi:MYXO-CTERM domain-containing protein